MKPEDQRIALAEFDGWEYLGDSALKQVAWMCWSSPEDPEWRLSEPPNYLSDLNAIRPLLLKLNDAQQKVFAHYVADLTSDPDSKLGYEEDDYFSYIEVRAGFAFKMLTLSPELLCKALLKTLKLWA